MVRLRLRRDGRRHRPFYHIVAADARSPRDGRFIEKIGYYNPMQDPAEVLIDHDLALKWLKQGAQPTETVRSLLSKQGILLKFHLIKKGKTEEEIQKAYEEWKIQRDAKLEAYLQEKEKQKAKVKSEALAKEKEKRAKIEAKIASKKAAPAESSEA
jgi:small subunit ribosomal protein S16